MDRALGREVAYRVSRTRLGLAVSYVAGVSSGLLGIGGGVLKVPVMNLAMGIPIKACTATSNFMIGVTAAASAAVYLMRGEVLPFCRGARRRRASSWAPRPGPACMTGMQTTASGYIFVAVLVVSAVQMLLKGLR